MDVRTIEDVVDIEGRPYDELVVPKGELSGGRLAALLE